MVSDNKGTVRASYAHGVGLVKGKNVVRGGLAAINASGATIAASYSTGGHSGDGTGGGTTSSGGLAGSNSGTVTNGYWDTETSGITDTGAGAGTGKTTSQLQTPTAYGTGNDDIYKDWDIDLDTTQTETQDGWDFGNATQYPAIKYGLTADDQRPTVALAVANANICESDKGYGSVSNVTYACGSDNRHSTTVSASVSSALEYPVTVTLDTNAAYTLASPSTITIAAGATSQTATVTLTADNDKTDAADNALTVGGTADNVWTSVTGASLTIKDDDNLAEPTGFYVTGKSGSNTTLNAHWNAVTNATGYYVDWKSGSEEYDTSNTSTRRATISSGSTLTYEITGLTSGTTYTVRLIAYQTGYDDSAPSDEATGEPNKVDYDTDNDRLIEITTIEQLNAIRHDLSGVGSQTHTDYTTAYPNPATTMGCPSSCQGYEIANDLDFDTNGNGRADSSDTYWNNGAGWTPIGIGDTNLPYTATLEGNENEIKNLYINGTGEATEYFALFYHVSGTGTVKDLYLTNVSVTGASKGESSHHHVYVGALTSWNSGTITDSYVTGSVTANQTGGEGATAYAGGFIGQSVGGPIRKSYSSATVTATVSSGSGDAIAGGLMSWNPGGPVEASYATGDITATASGTGNAYAGGLVGNNLAGTITAAYATGDVSASAGGTVDVGGLVGNNTGTITAAWSKGVPTGDDSGTNNIGGLIGAGAGTVTNAYWDTEVSGIADDVDNNAPEGKTTSELQTPTEAQKTGTGPNATYPTGIYSAWNLDIDNADNDNSLTTGRDNPWDFGTATQYPVLHVRTLPYVLLQEVPTVTWAVANATLCESSAGTNTAACGASPVTSTTITPTLSDAWKTDLTYTFPEDATKYTLSKTKLTIPAGSTTVGGVTLTAVNNKTDASDATVNVSPTSSHLRQASTVSTITIKDDDILTKPTGVKLSVDGTKIQVDWTATTGATGYTVEWSTSSTFAGTPSSGTSTTNSHKITTGLTSGTTYYFRVTATKTGYDSSAPSDAVSVAPTTGKTDYDADNDGLIEITTLAQLNAMRWDLDGNGSSTNAGYATAFPNAEVNMGCKETAGAITANDTGNPACTGYELRGNLDFDEDSNGNRDDTYNTGAGWVPIGDGTTAYTGDFDGNNDSDSTGDGGPYAITNLFINASSTSGTSYAGLFGVVGAGAEIENVALTAASVTGSTTGDAVYAGALAGKNSGTITESWSLGAVTAKRTGTGAGNDSYAGGLVGQNNGTIRSAYSRAAAAAAAAAHTGNEGHAGGLVGVNESGATIAASYATGDVTANRGTETSGNALNNAYAGGLVAVNNGTITASYATGDGTTVGRNTNMGGFVATNASGATITGGYSLGKQTATTGSSGTANTGGFAGSNAGTIQASYWDTATSGIADDDGADSPEGKTTSQLQLPADYGEGTADIFAEWAWNRDIDGDSTNDDPWDFGTTSQYPVLKYGSHVTSKQRATLTITPNPTTIYERADTGLSRLNASTITASLGDTNTWEEDLTVTLPTADASKFTLSATTFSIAAGSTSQTIKLTAVDDTENQAGDPGTRSVSLSAMSVGDYVIAVTVSNATITINDDDNVAKATGVKLSVDGTKIQVDWTAAAGATGYEVQWNTSDSWTSIPNTQKATVSGGTTVTYTISPTPALTADTRYHVRVISTRTNEIDAPPSDVVDIKTHATSPATVDYDADNDGLIEVKTLAQLNAIRWDLDGDGVGDKLDSNNDGDYTDTNLGEYDYTTNYAGAFPNAEDNMGCNESAVTIASNNTGNPACSGYELSGNLDFDTNGDGRTDITGDTYWNSGSGWQPIAHDSTDPEASSDPFNTTFEGNNYVISNLFINRAGGRTGNQDTNYRYGIFAGLFGDLGSSSEVRNLGVEDVSVSFSNYLVTITGKDPQNYAGGLAGYSAGEIFKTYVTGSVTATANASGNTEEPPHAGGLIGKQVGGSITSSYARVTVTANQDSNDANAVSYAGGLVAYQDGGNIIATYARGSATAIVKALLNGKAHAGGLIGYHKNGEIKSSYSEADATAEVPAGSFSIHPTLNAGGLVGTQDGGKITASYSVGTPSTNKRSATGNITENIGGLTGKYVSGTTTNSYWDTDVSDITATGQGTGKTTSELQTPTTYGTGNNDIYKDWDIDLDTVKTGLQDPWDFGTASDYPALKYHLTIPPQRATITMSANRTTICESAAGTHANACSANPQTSAIITATLANAWHALVTVTIPANEAYTLSPATISLPAGTTSATTTLTAENNKTIVATDPQFDVSGSTGDPWVSIPDALNITITDEDKLAKPTGVKLSVDGSKIQVDWSAVTDATGYTVQWNSTSSTDWSSPSSATISSGSTVTHKITSGLDADKTYYFRVIATIAGYDDSAPSTVVSAKTHATSPATVDYDDDNDGLIEISNLAQLNAIRWDLDGDGALHHASYKNAFPNAETNMGCSESVASITSNNTGNEPCKGYELTANLDFDTGTKGTRNDDTYWNGGQGWLPIGATAGSRNSSAYTGEFHGRTFKISNLYINRGDDFSHFIAHGGLFAKIGSGAKITNLRLEGVSVSVGSYRHGAGHDIYTGGIAGESAGSISGSYVIGAVKATQFNFGTARNAYAGGLFGKNTGSITSSYALVTSVDAEQKGNSGNLIAYAGGLVGYQDTGTAAIAASYANGVVTALSESNSGANSYAGGLIGYMDSGNVKASYSHAAPKAKTKTGATGATLTAGGLIGQIQTGASVAASYSTGAPTAEGGSAPTIQTGGLAGRNNGTTNITNSYWDTKTPA